jgi:hypothetical protein
MRIGNTFSRRSLLRGLGGGAVLCSGISRSLYAQTAQPSKGGVPRAVFLFYANGSHPMWTPDGMGADFVLKPHMAPMEPIRKDIVIFRNMVLERGSGNSHKGTSFSCLGAGATTSFDQTLAASKGVKDTTPLASLEISIGYTTGGGGVIPGLSQIGGQFLPGVRNPVDAYKRIADRVMMNVTPTPGQPVMTDPMGPPKALLARKSLLDYLNDDVKTFRTRLGGEERGKMDFYLESLRSLEMDIGNNMGGGEVHPSASCSKGMAPESTLMRDMHVNDMPQVNHLFFDTIAMGLACGVTRIASVMLGGGQSDEPVKINDISMGDWHSVSHGDPAGGAGQQMIKMQAYMAAEFTYLVTKLKTFQDVGGSLLDNTAVILGTQNGTSTQVAFAKMDHDKHNSPMVLAGRCGGAWTTGKVVDCDNRTHNDVYMSIAKAFGIDGPVGNPAWCKGPLLTS